MTPVYYKNKNKITIFCTIVDANWRIFTNQYRLVHTAFQNNDFHGTKKQRNEESALMYSLGDEENTHKDLSPLLLFLTSSVGQVT